MKNLLLSMLLCMMTLGAAAQSTLKGDVDGDGRVTIGDVTALIDYLLTGDASGIYLDVSDVDGDGRVTIGDVTSLIDFLLNGTWNDNLDDHDWVDLGLPSGTLWATCNVGATAPEDFGDYFAWGETESKDDYDWSTYKWCNGSNHTLTKYVTDMSYGFGYNDFVDNKTELDLEDDAAYVNWGSSWRMPTKEQQDELMVKCSWQQTTQNGVKGHLVTGPNNSSLFLPAAGRYWGNSLTSVGYGGHYWSRTLYPNSPYEANYLYSGWGPVGEVYMDRNNRDFGFSVRAVRVSQD